MNTYRNPMQPWPGLEPYVQAFHLSRSRLKLFAYDTANHPAEPLILLLHGLGDEADTWRHLIAPLAAYGRVVAPDLPGFGRSDKPLRSYSIAFLCDAIQELLEQIQAAQVFLAGHSMGAVLAQTLALEQPARLKGLVLVDGTLLNRGLRLNPQLLFMLAPGLGEWWYTRLRKDPRAAYETLRPYYHCLENLPEVERRLLYQRVNQRVWDDAQRAAYLSTLRNLAPFVSRQQKELPERLARLAVPTLVIWGEDDRIVSLASGTALAQIQTSARLVTLPQTGHQPQQECPQALIQAILSDERLGLQPTGGG
jgi:pimeloyl-ACP methyl ester carboxylesterase